MDKQALEHRLRARSMSQAELARRIGVSRQAVSLWFKQPGATIRVRAEQLLAVARVLGVSVERLTQPLPFRDGPQRAELQTALLWDHLYPSIDEFAVAIKREEPRAIARLVEVHGLYAAAKLVGRAAAWKAFPRYRRFIPPVRRRQLESLWAWKTKHLSS